MHGRRLITVSVATVLAISACVASPSPRASSDAGPSSAPSNFASPAPSVDTRPVVTLGPAERPLAATPSTDLAASSDGYAFVAHPGPSIGPLIAVGLADGTGWELLDASRIPGLEDVAKGPGGWVAVERIGDQGTAIWSSRDGRVWTRLADQAGLASTPSGPLVGSDAGYAMTSGATVFTSRDGAVWRAATALADLPVDRVVAVGNVMVALSSGANGSPPDARASLDGITWTPWASRAGDPLSTDARRVELVGLGSTLVAYAPTTDGMAIWSGSLRAGVADITWTREDAASPAFSGAAALIGAGTGTGVALGYELGSLRPLSWTTTDGKTWARHPLAAETFDGGTPLALAATGASFVAIARAGNIAGDLQTTIWRSTDGVEWQRADNDVLGPLATDPQGPCPGTPPAAVEGYLEMAPALWPTCFGSKNVVVTGYVAGCGGCGGMSTYDARPSWLAGVADLGYSAFWLTPQIVQADTGPGGFGVAIDPAHRVTIPAEGTHVAVTGHFDDAAARSCRLYPLAGSMAPLPSLTWVIGRCRREFVATGIRTLSGS